MFDARRERRFCTNREAGQGRHGKIVIRGGLNMRRENATGMARVPVARRKRRSPEEIMDRLITAAAEEFKRSGFAGATTATIARNAEVTEAQLFRYFGSKTDLFREAIFKPLNEHFFEFNAKQLADVAEAGNIGDRRRLYITELQHFIGQQSKMLMSLLVAETYAPGSTQGVGGIDSLRTYFGRGAAMMSGRMDKDPKVDPRLMVRVSFAAVLGCVMFKDLIFPPGLASDDEISAAIIDFLIDGISANSDPGPMGRDNIL